MMEKVLFRRLRLYLPVSLLDVSSNFEHDVRLICVLTVYGRKVR